LPDRCHRVDGHEADVLGGFHEVFVRVGERRQERQIVCIDYLGIRGDERIETADILGCCDDLVASSSPRGTTPSHGHAERT
jgi:hypothetical protein